MVATDNRYKIAALAQMMPPMQLITTEDFTLFNGGPKFRRAYMDWSCFHNEPRFFQRLEQTVTPVEKNTTLRLASRYK